MPGFDSQHSVSRRKLNRLDQSGVFTVFVPVGEDFIGGLNHDEATLESHDGAYKQTIQVSQEGKPDERQHVRLTFRGVVPGKKYTLTYDTKLDAEGGEVMRIEVFHERLLGAKDLKNPLREAQPFHNEEDEPAPAS